MKIFKKDCLAKRMLLVLLLIILLNTTLLSNVSYAGLTAVVGGKLLQPVCDLVLSLGDGIMNLMQKSVIGMSGEVTIDLTQKASKLAKFLGIAVGIAVFVILAVATGGISALIQSAGTLIGATLAKIAAAGVFALGMKVAFTGGITAFIVAYGIAADNLPDITVLPTYGVSPEEIFEGKLLIFDINFFNPKQVYVEFTDGTDEVKIENYDEYVSKNPDATVKNYYYRDSGEKVITSKQNTAMQLSKTISKWYYSIRNIAIVIMMLILVYIGIRMILCSIASEKSKYRKMLVDWVVSMCLVFILHYIMVFAVNINESIVKLVKNSTEKNNIIYIISFKDMDEDKKQSFMKSLYEVTDGEHNDKYLDENGNSLGWDENVDPTDSGNIKKAQGFLWVTNLIGQVRMSAQNQDGTTEYVGYTIAFLVLVFYTVFFAFTYLKRVLYMAFLTIIAPLVAMTYSIDKINDGKAQAFNMWLKEYIFNLLIQPMHLMLYMVLISMAYELAAKNIIYTLVAIGFMIPAEKFVRKMFGFEKAQTPGLLGGAAGAALTMNGMQKLAHIAGHGPGAKGGNKPAGKLDKSKDDNDPNGIYNRSADSGKGINFLADEINGNNTDENTDTGSNEPFMLNSSGGPSAADANMNSINMNDPEDPIARMQREALEEKIADGQITPEELNGTQGLLLGMNNVDSQQYVDSGIAGGDAQIANFETNPQASQNFGIEQSRWAKIKSGANNARRTISNTPVGSAARAAGRAVGQNKDVLLKTAETGVKLTGKAFGTATGAVIGAAAGIASGDIRNVGKNMALGATAGSSIGAGVTNMAVSGVSTAARTIKTTKTEIDKDRYGEQYAQHIKEKQDKKFLEDKDARRFYEREFSEELKNLKGKERKERVDQIMNNAVKYRQNVGVTDNKIISRAMKLDHNDPTSAKSMAAAYMASNSKDLKGIEPYQKKFAKKIGEENASKIADNAAKIAGYYK